MTAELPRIPDELAASPATDKLVWNVLYDADEPMTAPELADVSHTPRPSVYRSLDRLVAAGLVDKLAAVDCHCQWSYRTL